jgi:hypothetical protein
MSGAFMQVLKWFQNSVPFAPVAAAVLILQGSPAAVFADPAGDVAALEAQCEKEREEKIKPLREMEIAKCKTHNYSDPGYCERYWKDYGNAVRIAHGGMTPRMFDDLPICVEAFKARKALINR